MSSNDCLNNQFESGITSAPDVEENVQTSNLPAIDVEKVPDLVEDTKVNNLEKSVFSEENETTITLEDSKSEDSDTDDGDNDDKKTETSSSESDEDEDEEYLKKKQADYEEFAKNLIIVDRKCELGSPSFTINTKTGSMIITAKSKEDIEKVQNQFYSTRNRLKEQKTEITPEAFKFFHDKVNKTDSENDDDSSSENESNTNYTVTVTREMINASLANLQILKLPPADKVNVSYNGCL